MGIAITTRFHGPTNTRGSRYSATASGKPGGGSDRFSAPSDYCLNASKNHAAVAHALALKLGWSGLWIGGGIDGSDLVFVNVPVAASVAAAMALQMRPGFEGEDWFFLPNEREGSTANA